MIFSRLTYAFGFFIIISASFMRQIHDYLFNRVGPTFVTGAIWTALGLAILATFLAVIRSRNSVKLFLQAIIVSGVLYYAWSLKIPAERVHIINFGLLGWLMCRDTYRRRGFQCIPLSIIGCAVFASLEELFQYFLPYRVGEARDVLLALTGAVPGIALYILGRVGIVKGSQEKGSSFALYSRAVNLYSNLKRRKRVESS